jgi:hypothetical protein
MLESVRLLVVIAAAILAGCTPAPPPRDSSGIDATQEDWYAKGVEQLAAMDRGSYTLT